MAIHKGISILVCQKLNGSTHSSSFIPSVLRLWDAQIWIPTGLSLDPPG